MLCLTKIQDRKKFPHEHPVRARAKPVDFLGGFRLEDKPISIWSKDKPLVKPVFGGLFISQCQTLLKKGARRLNVSGRSDPHDLLASDSRRIDMLQDMRGIDIIKRGVLKRQGHRLTDEEGRGVWNDELLTAPLTSFPEIDINDVCHPFKRIMAGSDVQNAASKIRAF